MVVVHSATKGLAAMTLAVAHSRGWLDYEERVATYWPEFAQQGKETITVRQLLAHQAGLFAFEEPVDRNVVADLDRLAVILARQKPTWDPGTRQAYHASRSASTRASCCGGSIRAIAASDNSFRTRSRPVSERTSTSDCPRRSPTLAWRHCRPQTDRMLTGFPFRFTLEAMNPRSNIYRALVTNPGPRVSQDEQRMYARDLEVPSGLGVGTARGYCPRLRRLRRRRTRVGIAAGDTGLFGRARHASDARVL